MEGPLPSPLVNMARVRAFCIAALVYFGVGLLAGFLFSLQFLRIYPFPTVEWLSPGRVRVTHTSLVAFGFLATAMLGLMEYVIPKLMGRPVLSDRLGWLVFAAWNGLIIATVHGVLTGRMQGIEWGETPTYLDPFFVVGFLLAGVNLIAPVFRARGTVLYVSCWYFTAAFIWTALNYTMGNFLPQYVVPGAAGAALTSMYIHDLVGLLVTPIGWGLMYFLVPAALRVPIYSHKLSLIGFWLLAFFYPLNSSHHYLWSPIPMWVQYAAVVASVGVHVVVYSVIFNFWATLRGHAKEAYACLPVRWFATGALGYLLTCIQCAVQVTLTAQEVIHFTDWVVGHAHLVMFGVFGFWMLGFIIYLWPRLTGRNWYSTRLLEWHFWLCAVGIAVMWTDLLVAGVVQGYLWKGLAPFMDSVRASVPFWFTRTVSGVAILTGTTLFFYNLVRTALQGETEPSAAGEVAHAQA